MKSSKMCSSIVDLRRSLLEHFGWLADLYMVDFFVENHWNRLPSSWRATFENVEPWHWYDLLSDTQQQPSTLNCVVLPLSFICFRRLIEAVSLRRQTIMGLKQFAEHCRIGHEHLPDYFPPFRKCNELRVKVKLKKQHEIDRICHAVELLQRAASPSFVELVDVGAGLGHLSRQIAVRFAQSANPLRVSTIEADEELVRKARWLDSTLRLKLSRNERCDMERDRKIDVVIPERKALFLEPGQKLDGCNRVNGAAMKCVIGLHTCGDLSSFIIREFVADPTARVLLHFGCCYHKLNGGADKLFMQEWTDIISSKENETRLTKGSGFPMSATYAQFSLSYAARELSCHAIERFRSKLRDKHDMSEYRIHCFRAVLEWLIVKVSRRESDVRRRFGTNVRHMGLRSVKGEYLNSFSSYLSAALSDKRQLYNDIMIMLKEEGSLTKQIDEMISQWRRIIALYCIRLALAKLTETVILDDRRCFVEEKQCDAYLVALFDAHISARNIALVCIK